MKFIIATILVVLIAIAGADYVFWDVTGMYDRDEKVAQEEAEEAALADAKAATAEEGGSQELDLGAALELAQKDWREARSEAKSREARLVVEFTRNSAPEKALMAYVEAVEEEARTHLSLALIMRKAGKAGASADNHEEAHDLLMARAKTIREGLEANSAVFWAAFAQSMEAQS